MYPPAPGAGRVPHRGVYQQVHGQACLHVQLHVRPELQERPVQLALQGKLMGLFLKTT